MAFTKALTKQLRRDKLESFVLMRSAQHGGKEQIKSIQEQYEES